MTTKPNPWVALVDSIQACLEFPMRIKVSPMTKDGDLSFSLKWISFSWSNPLSHSALTKPIFSSSAFINLVATIIIESRLQDFLPVIESKSYPSACKLFRHTGFGLKISGQDMIFFLHCQYLVGVYNQYLSGLLTESQKEIIDVPAEKKKLSADDVTVTAYTDSKSYKVTVSKQGNLENSIGVAIQNCLYHFGVRKDVNVNMGMFQMEVEVIDK